MKSDILDLRSTTTSGETQTMETQNRQTQTKESQNHPNDPTT